MLVLSGVFYSLLQKMYSACRVNRLAYGYRLGANRTEIPPSRDTGPDLCQNRALTGLDLYSKSRNGMERLTCWLRKVSFLVIGERESVAYTIRTTLECLIRQSGKQAIVLRSRLPWRCLNASFSANNTGGSRNDDSNFHRDVLRGVQGDPHKVLLLDTAGW